jgi:hypothetical protein
MAAGPMTDIPPPIQPLPKQIEQAPPPIYVPPAKTFTPEPMPDFSTASPVIGVVPRPRPRPKPAPQPAAPQPQAVPEPQQLQMPPDVLAYIVWLTQYVDVYRCQMDRAALNELPNYMGLWMTGGLGTDLENLNQNPAPLYAQQFTRWEAALGQLDRGFARLDGLLAYQRKFGVPGNRAYVPRQCAQLHRLYGTALDTQVGAAQHASVGMRTLQMGRVMEALGATEQTHDLLLRSDGEIAGIFYYYGLEQGDFHIHEIPGQASILPFMRR